MTYLRLAGSSGRDSPKQKDIDTAANFGGTADNGGAKAAASKPKRSNVRYCCTAMVVLLVITQAVSSLSGGRYSLFFGILGFLEQNLPDGFNQLVNHVFYEILDGLDKEGEVTCMNYGYKQDDLRIQLDAADEPERYCLQMYHKIASAAIIEQQVDLQGKEVLEVGSGRGGGAAYIARNLHPHSMTGVELAAKAVNFCEQKHVGVPNLKYVQGNAEDLPFEDASFDVVINVESSHCYDNFPQFLKEVHRVLKPGGYFSWVDFREPYRWPQVNQQFEKTGFTELKTEEVTNSVVAAMTYSGQRNVELIDRQVPKFARKIFYGFAGVEGTELHTKLSTGSLIYTQKLLQKK